MKEIGKAVFVLEDDETGEIGQATVIEIDSVAYLVCTWLKAPGAISPTPEWLVPLAGLLHPGQELGPICSLKHPLPRELLSLDCPSQTRQRFGALLNPRLAHIQAGGNSLH